MYSPPFNITSKILNLVVEICEMLTLIRLIKDSLKKLKNDTLNETINDTINTLNALNATQKALLDILKNNPKITRNDMSKILNLSIITIQRNLDSLIKLNKIERIGAKKNGYYKLI